MNKDIIETICGNAHEIFYDGKVKRLNVELAFNNKNDMHIPLIILQDWTTKTSKTLLKLHIKEAIMLKSVIDQLILEYNEHMIDEVKNG